MTSILTFNSHIRYIKDIGGFNSFVDDLKPSYLLAYVDKKEHGLHIQTMQQRFPNTKIIARVYVENPASREGLEGKFHLPAADGRKWIVSPVDALNEWGSLGQNGLILNLLNEPDTYNYENVKPLTDWIEQVCNLAIARNISVMVGNFSTGHPPVVNGMWSSEYDRLLTILSEKRNQGIYLGLHEYGITAGRVGRLDAMVSRCDKLGIPAPNVIISEFGIDHSPNEVPELLGYRSRNMAGIPYADWIATTVNNAYRKHIDSGVLKAVCVFSYGNSGGWNSFDIEGDSDFRSQLLIHNTKGVFELTPPKPVTPAFTIAVDLGKRYTIRLPGGTLRKMYKAPALWSESNGTVAESSVITVVDKLYSGGDWWIKISYDRNGAGYTGWINSDGGIVRFQSLTTEFPPVIVPTEPTTPAPAENGANPPLPLIPVLTKADIAKEVIKAKMLVAYWEDLLARAA